MSDNRTGHRRSARVGNVYMCRCGGWANSVETTGGWIALLVDYRAHVWACETEAARR